MQVRWLVACGVTLLTAGFGAAQADRPTELPPLLTPPSGDPKPPAPPGPRGPTGEYDHGLFYLPDYVPPAAKAPETCRPLGRWWVNPSLELAWVPSRPAPAAVRLRLPNGGGTVPGPILPVGGREPDTFGGGLGLSVGRFLGDGHVHAIEGNFFFVGSDHTFEGFSPGMVVTFPHGSANSTPQVVVLPPPLDATFVGTFPATLSRWFFAADANYRRNVYCTPAARLDVLAGYRFASLRDELFLGERPAGGSDAYRGNRATAANQFHGGQVGVAGEVRRDRWYASGTAKVAFGVVTSDVAATGMFAGAEGLTAGGFNRLAALADASHTPFAVLPTVNLTAGRQFGEHARVFAGYSFQYLSRVARLGDVLYPSTSGTPTTDFWVQAVNFGVELRY